MSQTEIALPTIENLLQKAKLSTAILSFENYINGGNNRMYRLETSDGVFAIKKYFSSADDKRDRLASEFTFLKYAKIAAPHFVPQPYAFDAENGLALYEFIEGQKLKASDITEKNIEEAIQFFCLLNDENIKQSADYIPQASEAGFSIQDHLDTISHRLQKLNQVISADTNAEAKAFMTELLQIWRSLIQSTQQDDIALSPQQRCISPSDFGFHNALRVADGKICFIDFEYAGWDDPAKMANDFFSQLAVPIPKQYYDWFVEKVMQPFPEPAALIKRAKLLRPIYQIKWCCIALNVFIPAHLARRQFANPQLNAVEVQKAQLAKAARIISNLEGSHYATY